MTKLGLGALLFGAAVTVAACGGGGDGGNPDVIQLPADSGPTEPDAEVRGNVADFDLCLRTTDCMNPNSECVPNGLAGQGASICAPVCDNTSECEFGTYCWPSVITDPNLNNLAPLMRNHCWFSLCGEVFGSVTGQACTMGAETGADPSDQLPGWCFPIEDGFFGQCIEAGDVPVGGVCDFSTQTRGGANCDGTTLCIGQQGAAQGTCAEVCDPSRILAEPGVDLCTATTETTDGCFDSSANFTYDDGSTARQTLGFCTEVQACGLIGTNTCPAGQGCAATNSLRPTGICDASNGGTATQGQTCNNQTFCAPGLVCVGTCQTVCKTPRTACTSDMNCSPAETCDTGGTGRCELPYGTGPDVDCTTLDPSFTCQTVLFEDGRDNTAGTADDEFTRDWGACAAP